MCVWIEGLPSISAYKERHRFESLKDGLILRVIV